MARAKTKRQAPKRRPAKEPEAVEPAAEADDFAGLTAAAPDTKLGAMARVAARFTAWRPASEVLTRVRAVPTRFVQYDRATRVGGHPIERFTTIHGPSGHGKTSFCHGLGLSFLERGHFYNFVDAEYTSPEDWLEQMMAGSSTNPAFLALRPKTYEETVNAVREVCNGLAAARREGEVDAETSALIVVDSMRKLVPEDILAKIKKHGAEGDRGSVDGMSGRAAMIKAAMNASWLDELTPLLYHTRTAFVAIARESEDTNADANAKKWGNDFKVGGGKSLIFDASLVIRVVRSKWVKEAGDESRVVGEQHKLIISKTKVSGKDDRNIVCYFHTSNGNLVPAGFDRARDVLELAIGYEIVKASGAWFSWSGQRWNGKAAAVRKLTERPEALAALEGQVRARFAPDEKLEEEEAGEEES